jgi:hypothetical protein
MGIGGNDLQFTRIVTAMFAGHVASELSQIPGRLQQLKNRLGWVNEKYQQMEIPPERIFYVDYYDLLRNHFGELDGSCSGLGLAKTEDFIAADKVL